MTEDDLLSQFGLVPRPEDAPTLREHLRAELANEAREDNETLKTICVQLFAIGDIEDTLLIWEAKQSSFDAGCYIDVQLLCGAGLAETKAFLCKNGHPSAFAALEYIIECEEAGDFEEFTVKKHLNFYREYYGLT